MAEVARASEEHLLAVGDASGPPHLHNGRREAVKEGGRKQAGEAVMSGEGLEKGGPAALAKTTCGDRGGLQWPAGDGVFRTPEHGAGPGAREPSCGP